MKFKSTLLLLFCATIHLSACFTDERDGNFFILRQYGSQINGALRFKIDLPAGYYQFSVSAPAGSISNLRPSTNLQGGTGHQYVNGSTPFYLFGNIVDHGASCANIQVTVTVQDIYGQVECSQDFNLQGFESCPWYENVVNAWAPEPIGEFFYNTHNSSLCYDGDDGNGYSYALTNGYTDFAPIISEHVTGAGPALYLHFGKGLSKIHVHGPDGDHTVTDQGYVYRKEWNAYENQSEYYIINNWFGGSSSMRGDSPILSNGGGQVWYIGTDDHICNIYGSNQYEWGRLSYTYSPVARAGSDMVKSNDNIYYVDNTGKIRYFYWSGAGWSNQIANVYAVNAAPNTEMVWADGHLFYIGTNGKINFIDGSASWQTGVIAANAFAYSNSRMGMFYNNGSLYYFNASKSPTELSWTGSSWVVTNLSGCSRGKDNSPIYENGGEIFFVHEKDGKAHRIYNITCKKGSKVINQNDVFIDYQPSFELFPNPASNTIQVSSTNLLGDSQVEIMTLNGAIVYERKIISSFIENQIDISNLPTGVYLFRLSNKTYSSVKKFVKN